MTDNCDSFTSEGRRREPLSPELVVITGMSGAGRSEAMHTFEDMGYFTIDNLPPTLLPQITALAELPGSRMRRLAVVSDVRTAEFFDALAGELDALHEREVGHRVLFLETDDAALLNRFKETRRKHPLCVEGGGLAEAIAAEREALRPIRERADLIIDTAGMRPSELRHRILDEFIAEPLAQMMSVTVSSFGFKYGLPADADIVMDVRFLPNPYYNAEMRDLTGMDESVRHFVLGRDETADFLRNWFALLDTVMPGYLVEGKSHLSIGIGCTGGHHRSVALAEATAEHLRQAGFRVAVVHRDIERAQEGV